MLTSMLGFEIRITVVSGISEINFKNFSDESEFKLSAGRSLIKISVL